LSLKPTEKQAPKRSLSSRRTSDALIKDQSTTSLGKTKLLIKVQGKENASIKSAMKKTAQPVKKPKAIKNS